MNAKIIDWKKLSKTDGYKKLKSEWSKDRKTKGQKHRFDGEWKYIFNLLKKISYKHKLNPCYVLDIWESKRTCWYPNFYQKFYESKLEKWALELPF